MQFILNNCNITVQKGYILGYLEEESSIPASPDDFFFGFFVGVLSPVSFELDFFFVTFLVGFSSPPGDPSLAAIDFFFLTVGEDVLSSTDSADSFDDFFFVVFFLVPDFWKKFRLLIPTGG